jgi:hypothetical protein
MQSNISTYHSIENHTIENSTKRTPTIIQCPPVLKEHFKDGFNTVYRDDHDSVDYTVSTRTTRQYFWKWFWTIFRANSCTYLFVKHLVEDPVKPIDM